MPAELWDDALFEFMPSEKSGLILLRERRGGGIEAYCQRRATPDKTAERLTPAQALDVARLANIRMWEAYGRLEAAGRDVEFWKQQAQGETNA